MQKDKSDIEDDLRAEYDLKSLQVIRLGSERKRLGGTTVRIEPDVADVFPSGDAVNEALRFSIRIMRNNQAIAPTAQANKRNAPGL